MPPPGPGDLAVSVVSHGHGALVQRLLDELARLSSATVRRVIVTLNRPEAAPLPPAAGWPFALELRCNRRPLGFGANHNRALAGAAEPFVCVLNPDVALTGADPFAALLRQAAAPGVGCAYPLQVDARGHVQDSERELPTPLALWRRRVGARSAASAVRVDWVNAACLVLPQPVWQSLQGFDEAFYMYCEDVDLCLRLRQAGWRLARAPAQLLHVGQRASARSLPHLRWHLQSLWRLWRSPAYRQALRSLPAPPARV